MSEITPEKVEALRLSLEAEHAQGLGGVVDGETALALIAAYQRLMGDVLTLSDKLSRAVVVEGTETPIVLERPAKLGICDGDTGERMLWVADDGIRINLRGSVAWVHTPESARAMAAQLAAMADALGAAQAVQDGAK